VTVIQVYCFYGKYAFPWEVSMILINLKFEQEWKEADK
jgi:hypothetical protein